MLNIIKNRALVLTPCTKNKRTDIVPEGGCVLPSDYLSEESVCRNLEAGRANALGLTGSNYDSQSRQVYAFDLYVRHYRTQLYKNLRDSGLAERARKAMIERRFPAEWFFLSGGYGLIHAFELGRSYQGTFSQTMAYQAGIPFTGKIWKDLPDIIDDMMNKLEPSAIYVFGPADYIDFVTATNAYDLKPELFHIARGRATNPELRNGLASLVEGLLSK